MLVTMRRYFDGVLAGANADRTLLPPHSDESDTRYSERLLDRIDETRVTGDYGKSTLDAVDHESRVPSCVTYALLIGDPPERVRDLRIA